MNDWTLPSAKSVKQEQQKAKEEQRKRETRMKLSFIKQKLDDLISYMDEDLKYHSGSGISKDFLPLINEYKLSDYFEDAPPATIAQLLEHKGWYLEDNGVDLTLKGREE